MDFVCTEPAMKEIVRAGFDPVFGARPLRRAIQKLIENPISSLIIEKKAQPGDTILVDYDGDNFLFNVERMDIDAPETAKHEVKSFKCDTCANEFTTEVLAHATPVCSKCASVKLTVVEKSDKKETEPKLDIDNNVDGQNNTKDEVKPKIAEKTPSIPPPPLDQPADPALQPIQS